MQLYLRSLLIIFTISLICYLMVMGYGIMQGIGATIGIFLLFAAVREHHIARIVLAVLAMFVLGLTFLSTQSPYQYARRHADEIVAAGCEMMNQWPTKHYIKGTDITDKNIPNVLRKLGAQSIFIDEDSVCIYVSGFPALPDREFIIYKNPNPSTMRESVFIKRTSNKDELCKINDKLWMTNY